MAAAKWEKQAARYARSLDSRELALPDDMIREADSYLDWIAPAVARHTDGAPIREAAGVDWGEMLDTVEPAGLTLMST